MDQHVWTTLQNAYHKLDRRLGRKGQANKALLGRLWVTRLCMPWPYSLLLMSASRLPLEVIYFLKFKSTCWNTVSIAGWIVTYMMNVRGGGSSSGYISSGFWAGRLFSQHIVLLLTRWALCWGLTLGRVGLLWVNKKVEETDNMNLCSMLLNKAYSRSANDVWYTFTQVSHFRSCDYWLVLMWDAAVIAIWYEDHNRVVS